MAKKYHVTLTKAERAELHDFVHKGTVSARKLTRPTRFFEPDWKLNIYVWPSAKLPGQEGALAAPEARKSP